MERFYCVYCNRKRIEEKIAVFDVINGCACNDCIDKYEKAQKEGKLKTPFD